LGSLFEKSFQAISGLVSTMEKHINSS